ncbi:MAG: hypothetical protein GXY52_09865 [Chloroflexi bacterium]|nr:hypothetical protein [Chloroflexota bacterium]
MPDKPTTWELAIANAAHEGAMRIIIQDAPGNADALQMDVVLDAPYEALQSRIWPVEAGRAYALHAMVKTALDRAYGQLRLHWLAVDGSDLGDVRSELAFCDHDYAPMTIWGVAPAGAVIAKAGMYLQAVGQMGRVGAGGSLWLSPASINPSLLLEAKPAAPGALFNALKPTEYAITVSGAPSDLAAIELSYRLEDFDREVVHSGVLDVNLKQGQAKVYLRLPALPMGYYELDLRANAPGLEEARQRLSLGSVTPLDFEPPEHYAIAIDAGLSWPTGGDSSKRDVLATDGRFATQAASSYRLGLRTLRDRLSWGDVNPQPGVFDWGRYGRAARIQHENGLEVYQVFHDTPLWALASSLNPTPNRSLPPWDLRTMYDLGARLAVDQGRYIRYFEVWNEPDGGFFSGHPWDIAALTKACALGIRDVDPTIGILSASRCTGTEFWEKWLANGAGAYVDIFNQHSYGKPEDQFALHQEDRDILARYGLELPIWMTEMGMRGSPTPDGSYRLAEEIQVSYILRCYACGLASGLDRFFFFYQQEFLEYGMHLWGVQRDDLTPKPSFIALGALIRQVGEAKVVGYLQEDDSYCIVFERQPGDFVGVAWSNTNSLVETGWAATLPVLEPGQDWSTADGSFTLPLCKGAYLVDSIGRKLRELEGDSFELKLSLKPVFVRGLDISRMQLREVPPTPHFAPSHEGFGERQHVFMQAVTRPSQPRLAHDDAQKQKNVLYIQEGAAEELALVVHNYSQQDVRTSVRLTLPQGWELVSMDPTDVAVAAGKAVSIRASFVPRQVAAGVEYCVSAVMLLGGAPQDQVAVYYYKGVVGE